MVPGVEFSSEVRVVCGFFGRTPPPPPKLPDRVDATGAEPAAPARANVKVGDPFPDTA